MWVDSFSPARSPRDHEMVRSPPACDGCCLVLSSRREKHCLLSFCSGKNTETRIVCHRNTETDLYRCTYAETELCGKEPVVRVQFHPLA
jgi:hypothetical protein